MTGRIIATISIGVIIGNGMYACPDILGLKALKITPVPLKVPPCGLADKVIGVEEIGT